MKQNYYKAAFSQADITPNFPTELIGCYRKDSRASGVLHPLAAQVLLLENGKERFAVIGIDNLGLTVGLSNKLRQLVASALEITADKIMLNFSHTHSAPAPLSPLNGERYFQFLCSEVISCVQEAAGKLQPCFVSWAMGETEIAENRRKGCSVVDKRLAALQVVNAENNSPIAVLMRVSAHANVLMTQNTKISSDYFGLARQNLSNYFGCPVMLIQGAAGNLKPVGVDKIHGGTEKDIPHIVNTILKSAKKLRFAPKPVTKLKMYERDMTLYSAVPTEQEAREIVKQAGAEGKEWLLECESLRKQGIARQETHETMQFFFLNEVCVCGVPDEIFCEIALNAAQRAQTPNLLMNGYTNGCNGYLPHREEWEKGGYETLFSYLDYYKFHGHVMPFEKDTAEKLCDIAVEEYTK